MQIDVVAVELLQTFQRRGGSDKLIGSNAKIDIAIRTKRGVGIQARDGPALDEHRLDALGAQQRQHVSDFAFVNQCRQSISPVNIMELSSAVCVCEWCI